MDRMPRGRDTTGYRAVPARPVRPAGRGIRAGLAAVANIGESHGIRTIRRAGGRIPRDPPIPRPSPRPSARPTSRHPSHGGGAAGPVGSALGNIALGLGVGAAVGIAFAVALSSKSTPTSGSIPEGDDDRR